MNIEKFLKGLDDKFKTKDLEQVGKYLLDSLAQAEREDDKPAQFTILNETMGFFRDTGYFEKSLNACDKCLKLMDDMGIKNTVDYATSLQNIANANRAAGNYHKAIDFYNEAINIYKDAIPKFDYRNASINNNMALVYQEMGDFNTAIKYLEKALFIIEHIEDTQIQQAITKSNLAASLLEIGEVKKAEEYLDFALDIFKKDEVKNFHYSAALSALATAKCMQEKYDDAKNIYEEALKEIEINMGKNSHAYSVTMSNYNEVLKKLGLEIETEKNNEEISGLEISREFYNQYGKKMIHDKFPEYESQIAVGYVGEGSEKFGFDDEFSRDHDFGPGFSMWMEDEIYEKIGENLNREYDKLPKTFMGIVRVDTPMAQGRCGADTIENFYKKYTGYRDVPTPEQMADIEDYKIATVTNGQIFKDDLGKFTAIRNAYINMPESVWLTKIARCVSQMAQTGQVNYSRSMGRGDFVTGDICVAEFMKASMQCVHLINKKCAPYYKWMMASTKELEILPEIADICRAISDMGPMKQAWENAEYNNQSLNENDMKVMTFEIVAKLIINQLYEMKIIDEVKSDFLGDYVGEIMRKASALYEVENMEFSREKAIDEIIKLEFEAFDKVKNKGGRAACQNNYPFFYIMRKSQYLTWTDEMLKAILEQWRYNKSVGWNMITEKYGRMMEWTAKDEYDAIKDNFPKRSEKVINIVDNIAKIQVQWMEEFRKEFPNLADNARDITSDNDNEYNTSYETYLKGELLTYSDELIGLYAQFIVDLSKAGKNLAYMTIENTAHLQGYKTLEEAEEKIKANN